MIASARKGTVSLFKTTKFCTKTKVLITGVFGLFTKPIKMAPYFKIGV